MTSQMAAILAHLHGVKATAKGFRARCPAHEDRVASLSLDEGTDGRVLLHCHAGCHVEAIVSAIGKTMADLMPPRPPRAASRKAASVTTTACGSLTAVFLDPADAQALSGRRVAKLGICPQCHGPVQVIVLDEPSAPDGPLAVAYCLSGCSADQLVLGLSRLVPDVEFHSLRGHE